ncbi:MULTISPECIES: M48 family metallopeptidase [Psychrobacter]|uniref:M48 family metallopeptidase n=1 Tax=Psychrobacter TaxID=497 RepID=UPI00146E9B89|nr:MULTISPECIES: SprT family zinc-dependent metalloprotease [Psychrobacter]
MTAKKSLSLEAVYNELAANGITLNISPKKVKNINFRLKPNALFVTYPKGIADDYLLAMLTKRLNWAIGQHEQLLKQTAQKTAFLPNVDDENAENKVLLWGKPQLIDTNGRAITEFYRDELSAIVPNLLAKWQPKTAVASEVRFKTMTTRWGSCNTRARRIWLSTYLPAYPIECTEYVLVHELCHLIHPNHSRDFWQAVATAMPDYQHWHDLLAGKSV